MNPSENIDKQIAGLDAKKTRAIDFFEGDKVDENALKDLVREAMEYNNK